MLRILSEIKNAIWVGTNATKVKRAFESAFGKKKNIFEYIFFSSLMMILSLRSKKKITPMRKLKISAPNAARREVNGVIFK